MAAKLYILATMDEAKEGARRAWLIQRNKAMHECVKWLVPAVVLPPTAGCGLIMFYNGNNTWNLDFIIPGFFVLQLLIGAYALYRVIRSQI